MDPNLKEILTQIRELLTALGILAGISATVITALNARRKEAEESRRAEKKAENEDEKQEVELTERLQQLNKDLLNEMDRRYTELQEELRLVRAELKAKEIENQILRKSGLRVILGIEASLKARNRILDSGQLTCSACVASDQELLDSLSKVRLIFEGKTPNDTTTTVS